MTEVVDKRFSTEPYKVMWKYSIPVQFDPKEIQVPVGSKLRHVELAWHPGAHAGQVVPYWDMWLEVRLSAAANDARMVPMVVQSFATEQEVIPKMAKHLATRVMPPSIGAPPQPAVWHLFEYPIGAKVVDHA